MITLDGGGAARVPLASEAQVVCAFATNMALTDVFIEDLCIGELLVALVPAADKRSGRVHRVGERRRNLRAGRGAAAIVAGAGIGGGAGAAIGAGG